jgi:hypothetical protein
VISIPHVCPKCIAEGLYYGILVFVKKGEEPQPGKCPHHKDVTLVPA